MKTATEQSNEKYSSHEKTHCVKNSPRAKKRLWREIELYKEQRQLEKELTYFDEFSVNGSSY